MILEGEAIEYLTVREYSDRYEIPEQTVRSRIGAGKLSSEIREKEGRKVRVIPVTKDYEHQNDEDMNDNHVHNEPLAQLTEYCRELTERLIEAESERKLLTHNQQSERDAYQKLEAEYHQKCAEVAELQAKLIKPWWKIW